MEEWKAVVGFEGSYEVSSLGGVRSVDRVDPAGRRQVGQVRILQIGKRGDYPIINLRKEGKTYSKKVHHLVMLAFVGPPPGPIGVGPGCFEVNHIDGIKANAAVTNLEYCTRQENAIHAVQTGLRDGVSVGTRNGRARLSDTQVLEIRQLYAAGGVSIVKLGRRFSISKSSVGYIVQGVTWKHLLVPTHL